MITLNILPPKNKKELKIIDVLIGIKDTLMLIFFGIMISSISLLGAKFFLQNHFNKTVNQNYLNSVLGHYSIKEIHDFNNEINTSLAIQNDFRQWSAIIVQIANTANDGIIFRKLHIQNNNEVLIEGRAKRRQDLTEFKNSLNSSNLFKEFTIPLDVLFQKENILFSLNLKLTL